MKGSPLGPYLARLRRPSLKSGTRPALLKRLSLKPERGFARSGPFRIHPYFPGEWNITPAQNEAMFKAHPTFGGMKDFIPVLGPLLAPVFQKNSYLARLPGRVWAFGSAQACAAL